MQLRTETEIEAPPARVWKVLTDFERYHEWNPLITHIRGELKVGSEIEVTISPPESDEMSFRPKLLACTPAEELRWRGKLWFKGLFDGEHFFKLHELDDGKKTRFVHGEDFEGILVRFLHGKLTHVARGFVYMNRALKEYVEALPR